jgi:hypothetical protein
MTTVDPGGRLVTSSLPSKNPTDAAALKKRNAVLPFLDEKSLEKRYDNARKMDRQAMQKQFKDMGF